MFSPPFPVKTYFIVTGGLHQWNDLAGSAQTEGIFVYLCWTLTLLLGFDPV